MNHEKSIANTVQTFLNVFGGVDGGVSFVKVKFKLETLGKAADSGDKDAIQIVEKVVAVERLISFFVKN